MRFYFNGQIEAVCFKNESRFSGNKFLQYLLVAFAFFGSFPRLMAYLPTAPKAPDDAHSDDENVE